MGLIGDVAKTILITTVVIWILAIISTLLTGQYVVALLLIIGFLIPLSFIICGYTRARKRMKEKGS